MTPLPLWFELMVASMVGLTLGYVIWAVIVMVDMNRRHRDFKEKFPQMVKQAIEAQGEMEPIVIHMEMKK